MATMKLLSLFQNVQTILVSLPVVGRYIDIYLSTLPLLFRFASGAFAAGNIRACNRPKKRLILYEYEGCPFCRKVREALSVLCLEVEIRPTPRETLSQYGFCDKSRFRPEVKNHPKGGHLRFPFLVDEGNQEAMYDSDVIIAYLWKNYGNKATKPWSYWLSTVPPLHLGTFLSSVPRLAPQFGFIRIPSHRPKQPLELWSFESSPFCRIVREVLCILELPYVLHNIPHYAEDKREEFAKKFGEAMKNDKNATSLEGNIRYSAGMGKFPWLVDPNTGVSMGESAHIVAYLYKTYKAGEMDANSGDLSNYSTKGASKDHGTIYGGKSD
jgi:glutathione S-transferase